VARLKLIGSYCGALVLCAIALILAGCGDPTADKTAATVSDAVEVEPVASSEEGAALEEPVQDGLVYAFDNEGSSVDFEGYKVTGPHVGGFGTFSGTVTVPDGDLNRAQIALGIDMTTTYSDNPDLTTKLLSPDFFEVETYPSATFVSTRIDAWPDGSQFDVTGNLALHGVTKGVTFPASISLDGTTVTAEAEFTIDRSIWGITYKGVADDLIRDDVLIFFAIEAEAQGG